MKFIKITILILLCIACKSQKKVAAIPYIEEEEKQPILTNDSVAKFIEIDKKIAKKVEGHTSLVNPLTIHFRKHVSNSSLERTEFKEWRREIFIEFSIDKYKRITYLATNTPDKKLDKQLKSAFKKLDFDIFEFPEYDSRYKYTLIVIQQKNNGKPIIKCSEKVIGYIPPVFEPCKKEISYQDLNNCNYIYITTYVYNNLNLSLATPGDIDHYHNITPKFVIDKNGKIVAAKIESENKALLENYYRTIKTVPKAISPAKLNGEPFYYGYTFPTTIANAVRNNKDFKEFFKYEKDNGKSISENIKDYIQGEVNRKQKERTYRVGF